MALEATDAWLASLTDQFRRWPRSHRSRSIWLVAEGDTLTPDGPKIDSDY
jgi:hypothetical protein